jgi:hypothetical protein
MTIDTELRSLAARGDRGMTNTSYRYRTGNSSRVVQLERRREREPCQVRKNNDVNQAKADVPQSGCRSFQLGSI